MFAKFTVQVLVGQARQAGSRFTRRTSSEIGGQNQNRYIGSHPAWAGPVSVQFCESLAAATNQCLLKGSLSLSLSLVYCFGRHEPSNNFCPHGSGICSDAWQPNNTKTMASERLINCDIPAIVACSYSVRLHMRVDQKQAELPWV